MKEEIQNQYIPHFWENNNNNNNKDNKQIDNSNSDNNLSVANNNVLTILRKYQKVFGEIETQISNWEFAENNIYIVFKNILSFLERYNILINTSVNSGGNINNSNSNDIKNDYFRMFNNNNNINNSTQIEFELQFKIINKLEESMVSMDEYSREMKKVIEKFDSLKIEIEQYWETNIFSLRLSSSNTSSTTPYDKSFYLKMIELNQGSYSNSSITQIDQWFHFIINTFKLEYTRRDNLLKGIEYTKPIKQLEFIFVNYEKNSTLSLNNIKEIIPKVMGVIKES